MDAFGGVVGDEFGGWVVRVQFDLIDGRSCLDKG